MAQDLPDDVWMQVAESLNLNPWSNRGDLHNMSLARRRMRRLLVPVLFRYLEFHTPPLESKYLMVRLIQNSMRARFLLNSPELLRYTRVFTLWENSYTLDSVTKYLALHEGSDSSSSRSDAENFVAVLHDAIFRLIFQMPGLRELHLRDIVMTPLCYTAISSRPLIKSLTVCPRLIPNMTFITPALPEALRLRDFKYHSVPGINNDRPTDPYLIYILDHCILSLEKLTIDSNLLPPVVARIPSHCPLSLRSLTVWLRLYDGVAVATFLQLLRASPQIRHLDLTGSEMPDIELIHNPLPLSLPNLSTISGTPRLLQRLSEGTNLVEIVLSNTFYLKRQSLTQVIRSSPTHLRKLSIWNVVVSETPHEFLTFIRSLAVFRNLERVNIAYEHDKPWKDHVSAQDSHNSIKDLLSQLASLRSLDINSDLGRFVKEPYDIGCPISKPGEPADRGHPSLEYIHVDFLCGTWSWDSRTGWEMSVWKVP